MRLSTMKGIAVGSLMGMTVGGGLMMAPQGKRIQRDLDKTGSTFANPIVDW